MPSGTNSTGEDAGEIARAGHIFPDPPAVADPGESQNLGRPTRGVTLPVLNRSPGAGDGVPDMSPDLLRRRRRGHDQKGYEDQGRYAHGLSPAS